MKTKIMKFCSYLTLLVMLSGITHATQHDLIHDDDHYHEFGHYEETYEYNCLLADVSNDETKSAGILPPAFLTDAPHLPRATTPHQTFAQAQYARGPPLTL